MIRSIQGCFLDYVILNFLHLLLNFNKLTMSRSYQRLDNDEIKVSLQNIGDKTEANDKYRPWRVKKSREQVSAIVKFLAPVNQQNKTIL